MPASGYDCRTPEFSLRLLLNLGLGRQDETRTGEIIRNRGQAMRTKGVTRTSVVLTTAEEHGVARVLRGLYHELMSLGPIPEKHVCRLFRDYTMSSLGLTYLAKLNMLVKMGLVAKSEERGADFVAWLDNDVMESINMLCETDVFDDHRSLYALSDIVFALCSSLDIVEEEDIEQEIDYLFDIPYQLREMTGEAPAIPGFRRRSFRYEDWYHSEKVDIQVTENDVSVSYKLSLRR